MNVFAVTTDTSGQPIAAIIISPLVFGLFLLIAALNLNPDEHGVIRIFMILLSFTTYFMTAWFGVLTIINYYSFDPMQNAIASSIWIFGSMFGVIVIYFLIYAFYKATRQAAQEKDEMMLQ